MRLDLGSTLVKQQNLLFWSRSSQVPTTVQSGLGYHHVEPTCVTEHHVGHHPITRGVCVSKTTRTLPTLCYLLLLQLITFNRGISRPEFFISDRCFWPFSPSLKILNMVMETLCILRYWSNQFGYKCVCVFVHLSVVAFSPRIMKSIDHLKPIELSVSCLVLGIQVKIPGNSNVKWNLWWIKTVLGQVFSVNCCL